MKKRIFAALALVLMGVGLVSAQPAFAETGDSGEGAGGGYTLGGGISQARGTGVPTDLLKGNGGIVNTIVNVMLFIVGVLSVIMIIFGGIRYVTSGGDQAKVTSAKNTIMYSVVGLIVAIVAYALINFVVDTFMKKEGE